VDINNTWYVGIEGIRMGHNRDRFRVFVNISVVPEIIVFSNALGLFHHVTGN